MSREIQVGLATVIGRTQRFACANFTVLEESEGQAHPNQWQFTTLFDLTTGCPVTDLWDLFSRTTALDHVAGRCIEDLQAQAAKNDWKSFPNLEANVREQVEEIKNWRFDDAGVAILFNQYTVSAYVVGPLIVEGIRYEELKQWFKPDIYRRIK